MAAKDKDKSLLEIAIELLQSKRKPQKILTILSEVMELKGYKPAVAKEHAAQFILDFMQSGYFVYCGDDCWDLKERQTTAVLDKDGYDSVNNKEEDDEAKRNELKEENFTKELDGDDIDDDIDDDDDDDDNDDDDDDLTREFDSSDDDGIEEIANISEEDFDDDDDSELNEEDFE